MKKIMKRAHEMTREMVKEYGVDYRAQLGLNLSYLLKEEEGEMTMEKWFENLTEQEQSRLKDGAEARTGFFKEGETIEEYNARKEKVYKDLLKEKHQIYLKELQRKKEMEELAKKELEKEEKLYEKNLEKGIATIELYESNKYRCWVAEVTGLDSKYGFDRNFINPAEVQGNYKTFELKEGKFYNYLNDNKQHFVKIVNSKIVEITKSEMEELVI